MSPASYRAAPPRVGKCQVTEHFDSGPNRRVSSAGAHQTRRARLCGPGWPTQADADPKQPRFPPGPGAAVRHSASAPAPDKHQCHHERRPWRPHRPDRPATRPARHRHCPVTSPSPPTAPSRCRRQAPPPSRGHPYRSPTSHPKILCARPFRADSIPGRGWCKLSHHGRRPHCNSARLRRTPNSCNMIHAQRCHTRTHDSRL
ncbi:hypothetical protein MKANGN_01990 [Mycobacterium kansasii]|uniref:Uncharacterized protein n=1 Tax=Mycobacterium kansasii TaxID=1768 RepID=A0A653F1P5_MYCKA|nr:hypothetical protein MKANGN_01990 [Mycobacterium kansasii]VTP03533.1 hypothetical protein BIN_B_03961 [Mycobacterium kansasii]